VLGYVLSALAYATLLAASLTLWRRRLTGSGLTVAIGVQIAWALVLTAQGIGVRFPVGLFVATEYLRQLTWALVLVRFLRAASPSRAARVAEWLTEALVLLVIAGAVWSLTPQAGAFAGALSHQWLWAALVLAIAGLVLLEQAARNTRPAQRWNLKQLWLGIGVLYAWDLALFSIGMLHGSAAQDFWVARGFVNALAAVLIAIAIGRITEWESAAFLSPRLVFFNATLLGAALYVLVMAVGSYYVRQWGGTWGGAGQILFLAAGGLVLTVAVLSDQFRAWSKVTLAKHFFPYRYDYRSEWLKLTRALSQSGEAPVYERIVTALAGCLNAQSGGLWLKDAEGALVPVGGELAPPGAPRESAGGEFFEYLLQHEWIYDLDEARQAQPSRKLPVRPPEWMVANPRLWLVVPLICEGALVGFVAIAHPLAEMPLTWEEIDLLRAAGRQVASFFAFEQAAKRLAEAHQFEAMSRMSAVIMHDLRHLIAQQALVVENAARHRGNPEFFDDAILTIENSVKRMTRLMEELRTGAAAQQTHRIALTEACSEAVRRCAGLEPAPALEARDRNLEVMASRERLLQVLEHVIRNAQQATPPTGSVTVSAKRAGQQAVIEVADTGCGMNAEFIRDHLFRPFDSTKGEQGFGIGAYQAREFARQCGGGVEVESTPGKGTRFIIRLPLAPALAAAAGGEDHELEAN
jgi:putative PEP-CTERM system histidine kinase